MPSVSLQDMFTKLVPPRPAHGNALEASFGLQDIERLLRENKAMRAKLQAIGALVAIWQAARCGR